MSVTLYRPYTTVADVQTETKNTESSLEDIFKKAINNASRWVEDESGTDFWFHDHRVTELTAKPSWVIANYIFLPWPTLTLTQITIDGVVLATDEWGYQNSQNDRGTSVIYRSGLSWTGYPLPDDVQRELDQRLESGQSWDDASDLYSRLVAVDYGPREYDFIGSPIKLQGTFGYTLSVTDPDTTPPPTIPVNAWRAATLVAAVFTGENRKEVRTADGTVESQMEYRIPKEARDLLKRFHPQVL